MRIYNDLVRQLDSGGGHYSQDLSEVDLSDPEDVKVVASDRQGAVLVHLGAANFLERYKIYVAHLQEWRQQFNPVESVDLRYDRQIIVNPDLRDLKQAPLSPAAARVAMSSGIRPAALITRSNRSTAVPLRPLKSGSRRKIARLEKKHWAKTKSHAGAQASQASPIAAVSAKAPVQRGSVTARPADAAVTKNKPSPAISKAQGAQ
jgi:cell division protein FtsQ